jgi:hypothetical protein
MIGISSRPATWGVPILHPYLAYLKRPPTRTRGEDHREPLERRSCPPPVGQRGLAARSESPGPAEERKPSAYKLDGLRPRARKRAGLNARLPI